MPRDSRHLGIPSAGRGVSRPGRSPVFGAAARRALSAPRSLPAAMPALLQGQRPGLRPLAAQVSAAPGRRTERELPRSWGVEARTSSWPRGGPRAPSLERSHAASGSHTPCSALTVTKAARASGRRGAAVPFVRCPRPPAICSAVLRLAAGVPSHGGKERHPPQVPLALLGTELQPSPSWWPQQPLCAPRLAEKYRHFMASS